MIPFVTGAIFPMRNPNFRANLRRKVKKDEGKKEDGREGVRGALAPPQGARTSRRPPTTHPPPPGLNRSGPSSSSSCSFWNGKNRGTEDGVVGRAAREPWYRGDAAQAEGSDLEVG